MTQPPPKSTPKADVSERLLKLFTLEQVEQLLSDFEEICTHGAGDVYIIFRNHHPLTTQPRKYRNFSKPTFE